MKWTGNYSLQLFICKNKCKHDTHIFAADLPVLVRMLEFNNGAEYYQAVNTDNKPCAFTVWQLNLSGPFTLPYAIKHVEGGGATPDAETKHHKTGCDSLNFPPNPAVFIYFIQQRLTAAVEDCFSHWLNQTV